MSRSTKTSSSRSAELYDRARKILPGGVSRNTVLRKPHPAYASHAAGCRVVDVEGVERIDFANNMASLIHGHADPDIVKVVSEQMARGSATTWLESSARMISWAASWPMCSMMVSRSSTAKAATAYMASGLRLLKSV